jgi:hypothetical protein
MAVFLAISARETVSKILAVWFPVMCFVGLGTDHVVANMYFVPLAIFLGSPDISVAYYIWKSMLPSALGNFVGGALFTALIYWYLYLRDEDVILHFDDLDAAALSPVDRNAAKEGNYQGHSEAALPDSAGRLRSGIAKDYHGTQFKRGAPNGEVHVV